MAWLLFDLRRTMSPGWDEASIGANALTLADLLRRGEFAAAFDDFHRARFYPPLGWLGHTIAFLTIGEHWRDARIVTVLAWGASVLIAARLARRLVASELADAAAIATVIFAFLSWLAVDLASIAMLESWCSLAIGATALLFVRAHERGTRASGLAAGLSLGVLSLVKYNYGVLGYAIFGAAEGYGCLRSWILARRGAPDESHTKRVVPWIALGAAIIPVWWYVLPLPAGLATARQHREMTGMWLQFSWGLGGLEARDLLYVYPILACGSVLALGLQIGGVVRAAWNAAVPAHRICALIAVAGPAAVAVYKHREERFLVPTLVAAWPLAGAAAAALVDRCVSRFLGKGSPRAAAARAAGLAVLLALTVGTTGAWSSLLVRLAKPNDPAGFVDRFGDRIARWARAPWNAHKTEAGRVADVRLAALEAAGRHLDVRQPFTWLNGAADEFPRPGVVWYLLTKTGNHTLLGTTAQDTDVLMGNPGWDEAAFDRWVSRYPQVVVLDPPFGDEDGSGRAEWNHFRWMGKNPQFRVRAEEKVEANGATVWRVIVYERIP